MEGKLGNKLVNINKGLKGELITYVTILWTNKYVKNLLVEFSLKTLSKIDLKSLRNEERNNLSKWKYAFAKLQNNS